MTKQGIIRYPKATVICTGKRCALIVETDTLQSMASFLKKHDIKMENSTESPDFPTLTDTIKAYLKTVPKNGPVEIRSPSKIIAFTHKYLLNRRSS